MSQTFRTARVPRMLVRATKRFRDLKEGVLRDAGTTFEVTEERLGEINSTRYGVLVEVVEEPVAAEVTEAPQPKRRGRRSTKEQ